MSTPTEIILSIYSALWLWFVRQIARAPLGYEDATGFHEGEKQL